MNSAEVVTDVERHANQRLLHLTPTKGHGYVHRIHCVLSPSGIDALNYLKTKNLGLTQSEIIERCLIKVAVEVYEESNS